MNELRLRYGGLFLRLSASYFAITLATAFMVNYVARFSGPFDAFRDNPIVLWFNRVGSNEFNSSVLFVCLALTVGTLTGVVISFNLTQRLSRITLAAEAWSRGDFTATARDTAGDELGQLARDLNRMAERLQTLLATRQELAVVEERNRLARELHDTVKQHVFASALLVRAARKQVDRDPETAKRHLQEAEELAGEMQQELITLIRALRPAAIEDRGLVSVVTEYAGDWAERTGITVDLRIQGERVTKVEVEETLYRVLQEALANVARHSGSAKAEIRLSWQENQVCLSVWDEGRGFDPLTGAGKGLGLVSMRERVEALGGGVSISSSPGDTRIEARVPIDPAESTPLAPGYEVVQYD
jgi:NarL family two-component system sensor histidine kinase LiaS